MGLFVTSHYKNTPDDLLLLADAPAHFIFVLLGPEADDENGEVTETDFRVRVALGRAAYNKLFLHNQGLIYHEVNKIMPNWRDASVIEKADFLQEGAQGLLRAIRLFDPARPVRFATYAAWHVRAHVLRSVRDKAHLVRLPQNLQADMHQIKRARYRCADLCRKVSAKRSADGDDRCRLSVGLRRRPAS